MSEMYGYRDRLFKNIFDNYEEFSTWYKSLPLSKDENDCPNEVTFALISYEYNDCHVAFSPEGFKEHFAIDLYTYYKEFEATTKRIDDLMSLSDSDVALDSEVVTNTANIPETEGSTNTEEVDFISMQQKNIYKKGKVQVAREQLSNQRSYTVQSFLKKFKHLFIKVISPAYTFVVAEDEGE